MHGLSLYNCRVCGTEGCLSQYCSQTVGIDGQEPDSHTLYPHMLHVPPHAVPHLSNRQLLPQTDNLDLQREVVRINKAEGLVSRPNHHEFDDEQSKMQVNKEIEECVCCEGRCNTHCLFEKNNRRALLFL